MNDDSQGFKQTLHLTPEGVWRGQAHFAAYAPEAFDKDGFIHCTDGEGNVIRTGNRYYQADPRRYVVVVIDLARVEPRVVYEDVDHIFPHIYGRLNQDAVVTVRTVERGQDGTFLRIGEALMDERHAPTTPQGPWEG